MDSFTNGVEKFTNGDVLRKVKEKKLYVLDSRFECPICLNCLKEPFLTTCGHRFCQDCIFEWLRKERGCPIDDQTIADKDLFPDNYTRREIAQQTIKCSFVDCNSVIPLLEIERHVIDHHEQFVSSSNTDDKIAKQADTWDPPPKRTEFDQSQLLKTLYEKVVLLEQKTRELELQLINEKRKVNELLMEKAAFESNLASRICNGSHVWNIPNIKHKLSLMCKDHSVMFYSDGFYTSYSGYKFCCRLNLSPNHPNYISLLVHLMKSENDFALPWPFKGRISFTLIHPTNSDLSLAEVMCTKPGLKAFEKPTANISPRAFGYTEFTLVDDILNKGFIIDDGSFNIKIDICCV